MRKKTNLKTSWVMAVLLLACSWLSNPAFASTWSIETVYSTGSVGYEPSIALDADGNPHISYRDNNPRYLRYAAFNGGELGHRDC